MNTIIGDYYYAGIKESLSLFHDDENLFSKLDQFLEKHKKAKLIFISYDLKNKIESLTSNNSDQINFPTVRCIVPEKILKAEAFKIQ